MKITSITDYIFNVLPNKLKLKTKKGQIFRKNMSGDVKLAEVLKDIETNHNHSWYQELYDRNVDNMDNIALIYRGNEITYREMFDKIEAYAKAMKKMGLNFKSEIPVCISNCPELVYILGAASRIGASVNIFGSTFPKDYIKEIVNGCNSKLAFIEDAAYARMGDAIKESNVEYVAMTTLRDSLKNDIDPCEDRDHFKNEVESFKNGNNKVLSQQEFINYGYDYNGTISENIDLDKDFVITYTSGSTNEKRPKAIVHSSRCYITVARYHNKDLNGGFVLKPYTFLSLIPTYSNSNILSIVSDGLMQGAKLAFEPIYTPESYIESLILYDPHYVAATKSYWVYTAKRMLTDPKYAGVKLKNLFLAFSCGERLERNEEKLINKLLKKVKAGTNVINTPFSVVRLSEAGGDCEHGSIFYTLFRSYSDNLPTNKMNGEPAGMGTFDFVEYAILDENGNRLGKNQMGRIVANSPCTMKRYKNNEEATRNFFIRDAEGKEWADLKVYGYVDDLRKLHMKGRMNRTKDEIPGFAIAKEVLKDTKNILSCEIIRDEESDVYIAHIELQPETHKNAEYIIGSANERCKKIMNEFGKNLYFRIRSFDESFPLTGSGKRSTRALREEGLTDLCVRPVYDGGKYILVPYEEEIKENDKEVTK